MVFGEGSRRALCTVEHPVQEAEPRTAAPAVVAPRNLRRVSVDFWKGTTRFSVFRHARKEGNLELGFIIWRVAFGRIRFSFSSGCLRSSRVLRLLECSREGRLPSGWRRSRRGEA